MKVLILRPSTSFLPEADAYQRVLKASGIETEVLLPQEFNSDECDFDLVYRFGGFLRPLDHDKPEVHEYSSASTGSFPRFKNLAKSFASSAPVGRVFTEDFVRRQFHFIRRRPNIFREIGVSSDFSAVRNTSRKRFDLVYVGSVSGRPGVSGHLINASKLGFRVGVAGDADSSIQQEFSRAGIEFVGRLPTNEIPQFIASSTHGLNVMPNVYPFAHQTSSKVIEYLSAGLTVVSNVYPWMTRHSKSLGYEFIRLERLSHYATSGLPELEPLPIDQVRELTWERVLERARFVEFVERCASH